MKLRMKLGICVKYMSEIRRPVPVASPAATSISVCPYIQSKTII